MHALNITETISLFMQFYVMFAVQDGVDDGEALGCTTSNGDRAGVLFRFPKDAERYVRDLIQHNF